MAVNGIEIEVGQEWITFDGNIVTIEHLLDGGKFLAVDRKGGTRVYATDGRSDTTGGYLASDIDRLATSVHVAKDDTTLPDQQLFASMDDVLKHIGTHGTQPGKVFFVAKPAEEQRDSFDGLNVRFAGSTDETVDADQLASETLQALGWVFDGQCWVQPSPMPIADDITAHPLYPVYMAAIEQAMYGKGQRHGGNVTPFLDQPWVHYVKMHGRGFATGQSAKKLEEAASLRSGNAFETEVLGAIVYAGMSILKERGIV